MKTNFNSCEILLFILGLICYIAYKQTKVNFLLIVLLLDGISWGGRVGIINKWKCSNKEDPIWLYHFVRFVAIFGGLISFIIFYTVYKIFYH